MIDIEGNQHEVIDAKERIVMRYDYDMLGSPIHQASMEAGERWMLNNVAGNPIRTWDSRGFQRRMNYDALQRPIGLFVTDTNGAEFMAEKTEYGESMPDPETTNHRSKPWKVYDGAGVLVSESYDFKDNLIRSTRQLLSDYKVQVDWAQNPQPENETFSSRTLYDALNRPIQIVAPHSSRAGTKLNVTRPVYNEANLLERVEVWLEQNAEPAGLLNPDTATQHAVKNIDYNARGQRELIEYGNSVSTSYEYDALTFRMTHLQTLRNVDKLQDLFYTYDPAGNITAIRDDAQQTIYFDGQVVRPDAEYTYDAIYRLIEAKGREHIGQASIPHTTWNDRGRVNLAHPNDGQKMRNYFEFYEYDEVGNILRFDHKAYNGNWIRAYDYNEASLIEPGKKSNRLSRTVVHPNGQQPISELYTHDSHGNMTSMPHLSQMGWDFRDQLHTVDKGGGCMAYYVYDAAGQRVRKMVEKNNGTLIEERIYLGGFEIFRRCNGSGITLERETLHIMDDKQRIALVEARTIDTQNIDIAPRQLVRYQLGNHLGSASLELDRDGQIISYEEYTPYGSTTYQAVRSQTEMPKRYRYTGKERDEESGLYYHGARYYAPWLGRWTSADPAGMTNGTNLYLYTSNNPVGKRDPTGLNDQQCVMPLPWEEELGLSSESTDPNAPTALEESLQMSIPSEHMPHMAETTPLEQQLQQSIPSEHNIESAIRTVSPIPRSAVRVTEPHIDPMPTRRGLSPTDPNARLRPAEHALGEHLIRGGRGRSPYVSASMNPRGVPNIPGSQRLYIDIDRAVAEGAEFISEADLSRDMRQLAEGSPQRYGPRAELWRGAQQAGEREVLFRGRIDPRAIDTPGMRALRHGGRVVQVYGAAMTIYDMGSATVESIEVESPRPITAETVRQVGSWGGAWLGFKVGAAGGALLGIETGPGAIVTGLVGGLIFGTAGYFGADWVADYIYEN